MDPTIAAALIDQLAALLLIVAIGSLLLRDLAGGIFALTAQAAVLVAIGLVAVAVSGEPHGWLAVALTLAVKGVAIPLALRATLATVHLKREVDPVLPDRVTLLIAVGLAILGHQAAGQIALPGRPTSGQAVPIAVGLMLVGLLMMVTRRKALSQVFGLVTLENGIYLAALAATDGLPLAVELAVAFDVLVGAILMAFLTGRISRTFLTINTDQLNALRDVPLRTVGRDGERARAGR
jgi:hydrogenase-4 component E